MPDRQHQLTRIRELADHPDAAAVEELLRITDPVELSAAALDALTDIARQDPDLVQDVLFDRLLNWRAVRALARSGHADRTPALLGAILERVDDEVVLGSALELGGEAVEHLVWQLTARPLSARTRRVVFDALTELDALAHPAVLDLLATWLTAPDCTRARYELCCELLGRLDPTSPPVRALLDTLPTDDQARRSVRWLRGLATAGAEVRFVRLALEREQHDPEGVRQLSRPLRELRTDDARRLARPMLRRFLDERASWTVRDAIAGLGHSGNGSDIVRLRRFCAPSHFALRESAHALARLGDPGLAEHLHRIAPVCNARDLVTVAEVLELLGELVPIVRLVDRLSTCPGDHQQLLVEALTRLAPADAPAAREGFVALLQRPHRDEIRAPVLRWLAHATATPDVLDAVRAAAPDCEAIAARLALEPTVDADLVDAADVLLAGCRDEVRCWWSAHLNAGALALDARVIAEIDLLDRGTHRLLARHAELTPRGAERLAERLSLAALTLHGVAGVLPRCRPDARLREVTARLARGALVLSRALLTTWLAAHQIERLLAIEVDAMGCETTRRELVRRGAPGWLCEALAVVSATAAGR